MSATFTIPVVDGHSSGKALEAGEMTELPQIGDVYRDTTGWRRKWLVIGGRTDSQAYDHVRLIEPHTADPKTLALSVIKDRSRFLSESPDGSDKR